MISDSFEGNMLKFKQIFNQFTIDGFYSAFEFYWSDDFAFSGESHNFWEVVFVEEGDVEVTEDENVYVLGAGNIIFHAPMEFHRIKSLPECTPSGFILSFKASGDLPQVLSDGVFTLDPKQMSEYKTICDKAFHFYNNDRSPTDGQELAALFSLFLINLGAKKASPADSMSQSAIEYRKIVSYMFDNLKRNLTLADIATENNVSISYIKLLFSNYAGISPKCYFNQMRVRRATELLSSGLSVTEVSDIMNFSSPNYFSAFYKKHTGLSPSVLQKG